MVCAPVRSLKLGDYLSVQAHKPCSISHLYCIVRRKIVPTDSSIRNYIKLFIVTTALSICLRPNYRLFLFVLLITFLGKFGKVTVPQK